MMHNNTPDSQKQIVITGTSRGIGLETARYLAGKGHRVLALSRNVEPVQTLSAQFDGLVSYEQVDLADESVQLEQLISKHFGRVDALINNAGALINKPFVETSIEDWRRLIDINLISAIRMVHACLPLMSRNAQVLNISSMGGFQGSMKFPGLSAYSTTKGALSILTECLSEELIGHNVHVNALCLGAVQTEMLSEAFPGYKAPISSEQMAAYIGDFAVLHGRLFNGKIIPVAINNPST
jgi:NAD(P)-dependent dehydrogenase (short-subunit alcohol dehydrogenase family)